MTTATMEIVDRAKPAFTQATALTVKTVAARKLATDLFDAIRAFRKQSDAQKEDVCRPLKQIWEDTKKPFDDFKKECEMHESALQQKMGEWDREQARLAREEQAKIQKKIDEQNAKIVAKAEAKGIEPVLKVAPVVQAPPKTVMTQAGTKQSRTEKTVYGIRDCLDMQVRADNPKVADLLTKFPGLFELDWVAFRKMASTGMLDGIPCVEKRTEYVYSQRG